MRVKEFLIEYNMTSLVNVFGDKLMAKWQAEGEPFKDSISDNEVTAEDIMKWFEQYDPTQNNKYITWMVNKYAGKKGGISRIEDIPTQLAAVLDTYEKLSRKNLLKPEHKNINQIKTLTDLHDIVDGYKKEDVSSKQEAGKAEEQEFYDSSEAELVYNDDTYKIIIPKTEEASCYFGKNTRWCTTGRTRNMFDTYHKQGSLYIILHKTTNEKWQWHFESKQYMDARDERIDIDTFLKKHTIAAHAVIKHYGGLEKAATENPSNWFKYIKNPSEAVQLVAVKQDGLALKYIVNPSDEIQLAAVNQKRPAIQHIDNPSKEIQLAAINQNGEAIKYIEKPAEEVQLAAVRKNGPTIIYIKNPTDAVKLAAVEEAGYAIHDIKNPSEAVQLAAVKQYGQSIQYIKNPSEAVQLAVVIQDGHAIQDIKNPTDAVKLAAVKETGYAIQHIKDRSEKVQLAAVKDNGPAIRYIENPSEAVQLAALNHSSRAILHIENPSEAVRRAARNNNNESVDFDLNRLQTLSGIK